MSANLARKILFAIFALPLVNILAYVFAMELPGFMVVMERLGAVPTEWRSDASQRTVNLLQFLFLMQAQIVIFAICAVVAVVRYALMPRRHLVSIWRKTIFLIGGSAFFGLIFVDAYMNSASIALGEHGGRRIGSGMTTLVLLLTVSLTIAMMPIVGMALLPGKLEMALMRSKR